MQFDHLVVDESFCRLAHVQSFPTVSFVDTIKQAPINGSCTLLHNCRIDWNCQSSEQLHGGIIVVAVTKPIESNKRPAVQHSFIAYARSCFVQPISLCFFELSKKEDAHRFIKG